MIASSSESDGRGANSKSVASSRPSRDLGTPLVLVIEDDPDAAEVASGMLQMLGFRVKHYPDAHHALYSLAEGAPDLILLDICLPEMDGVNLLKVARRVAEVRDVPVIAASAVYPRGGPIERSLRDLGVKVFMSKPFSLAGLRSAIDVVMPRHRAGRRTAEPLPAAGPLAGVAKVQGKDVSVHVVGGGEYHLDVTTSDSPLPSGESITINVRRRELLKDTMKDSTILILAHVEKTESAASGWKSRLSVAAARPQDAFDRLAKSLENLG